jgi:malate permease and related proteins
VAFSVFAQVLLPILVVVASGYLLQRRLELDLQSVNRLSLYLLSPALIFSSLVQSRIEVTETLRIGAFMTLFVITIGAVTWLVALLLQLDTIDRAALMLCVMFMKRVTTGSPRQDLPSARKASIARCCSSSFRQSSRRRSPSISRGQVTATGEEGSCGCSGCPRSTRSSRRWPSGSEGSGSTRQAKTSSTTCFAAWRWWAMPPCRWLLIILSLQLAETGRISEGPKVALATVLRLGLSVPLAVGLSYLLNLDELSTKLAVMLSSMPTAVNVTILAIEFNVRPRFVSSAVVVSTAASVFTLTLILVLLGVG